MNLEDILLRGTRAAQPLASAVAEGMLYFVTDEGIIEQARSSAWVAYSGASLITSGVGRSNIPLVVESEDPIENYFPIIGSPNVTKALLAGTGIAFDDSVPGFRTIATTGGSGGSWTLIQTQAAPAGPTLDFVTGFGSYKELMCAAVLVGSDQNTEINIQVSVDGGVSWLTTSGDYKILADDGTEVNTTTIKMTSGITVAVRSGFAIIMNSNGTTNPKLVDRMNGLFSYRIPTTSPINGIRFATTNVGTHNFSGGNFYLFGR